MPVLSGVQGPMNELLVNNLGSMGPVPSTFPGLVFGGVFTTTNGTLVDLVVRNESLYDPKDIKQTGVPKGSGFTSVNVRGGTSVVLNCTLVDRMTGLAVTVDKFVLTITDLNSQSDVRKMVVSKPTMFKATAGTTLTIATGSNNSMIFSSTSPKTSSPKPKDPMGMSQLFQDNAVELLFFEVSSFLLTLQTDIPQTASSVFFGSPSNAGRNFLISGPSMLDATAVTVNNSAINQSEMISAGQGLGGLPVPPLPVQKLPNATEVANATAAGVAPTGLPPIPATTPIPQPVPFVVGPVPTGIPIDGLPPATAVTPLPGVAPAPVVGVPPPAPVAGAAPGAPVAPCPPTAPMAPSAVEPRSEPSPMLKPIPAGTPKPDSDLVMCATEWSNQQAYCPECTMSPECLCNGQVTFGYDQYWTPWQPVRGVIECSVDTFGDPYAGHGKVCLCSPVALANSDGYWSGPTTLGTWWPLATVLLPAAALACLLGLFHLISAGVPTFGEVALQAAAPAAFIAPMIGALFIAVAKRGEYLVTDYSLLQTVRDATGMEGSPRINDYDDVSLAIKICAVAFILQLFFRVIYEVVALNERSRAHMYDRPRREAIWEILHHACVAVMYASIVYIFIGLFTMGPDMLFTPAVLCSIILSAAFFGCYIMLHVFSFFHIDVYGKAVTKLACLNMNFAPMLVLVYLGTQVAADELVGRTMPDFAKVWMKVCTAAVLVQTCLSVLTPLLAGAMLKQDETGREDLVMRRGPVLVVLGVARWALMAVQYAGVAALCKALWQLDDGSHLAQALSVLAIVYFAIYALMWMAMTLQHLGDGNFDYAVRALLALTHVATLCPIAAALLLGYWVTE